MTHTEAHQKRNDIGSGTLATWSTSAWIQELVGINRLNRSLILVQVIKMVLSTVVMSIMTSTWSQATEQATSAQNTVHLQTKFANPNVTEVHKT